METSFLRELRFFIGAAEGEVFFDQTRAQCNRGHGRGGAEGMVGQARDGAEPARDFGHLDQVGLELQGFNHSPRAPNPTTSGFPPSPL